ncbi:MAG TPA: inner membrane CreD family protein, partial [Steroidobacteraceae bacterium]|nr:inner membrane CreD family protein [Steroidobacteraceae bacterium]
AATACTLMIALYGRTLLGNWKASVVLGLGYGGLFGGLYLLLASEDHALLLGAGLTFVVLAVTMYLTRRLDWADLGRPAEAPRPAFQPE